MVGDKIDLNATNVVPLSRMSGDDDEDLALLGQMHQKARQYLNDFKWCQAIRQEFFGFGIGGVVAVFLFEIDNASSPEDDWLWVVVGDLPSAYLVVDEAKDAESALRVYIDLMDEWVNAVLAGLPTDDCYPVEAAPSKGNAEALQSRLSYLKHEVLD